MVDMAMHMMDITQNSIRANAARIEIVFREESAKSTLFFSVKDNGDGIPSGKLKKLDDPFFTTRTTRRVGLGVPFLKMTSEQAGGSLNVESEAGKGTLIESVYRTDNPDCLPLGDLAGYLVLLLLANPDTEVYFSYRIDDREFSISSEELAGEGITDLMENGMADALKEYINENLKELFRQRPRGSFLC